MKELHEVEHRKVQGPAPGKKDPQAPAHAEGQPAGKWLCRKGPGSPGGHESTMCPCSKKKNG